MKISKIVLALVLASILTGSAWSQGGNPGSTGEIPGYLDPSTNSFHPLRVQPMADPVAPATGKIVVNFTISVQSPLTTNAAISCSVSASIFDENPKTFVVSNFISESGSFSTVRKGATTKCTVTMAYSWRLANRSTDTVTMSYSISASPSSTTGNTLSRSSSQSLGIIPIPANGATTTENVNATI